MIEMALINDQSGEEAGQVEFTQPLWHEFKVPTGVMEICAVCIGASHNSGGVGGGGLSWRNHIPVIPGEMIYVFVGSHNTANTSLIDSYISRTKDKSRLICIGGGTNTGAGGNGGKNASKLNDGGGNGGSGMSVSNRISGGGAGGYTGNGGNGGDIAAKSGQGGGAGGGRQTAGGGTSIYGEGISGLGGSGDPAPVLGGNGSVVNNSMGYGAGFKRLSTANNAAAWGAVRIIWGKGRAFPSTNTLDVLNKG